MIRTYTMRLKVTRKQDEMLTRLLAQLCELYNMSLQQRRNAYKELQVSVNYLNQQMQLTELRNGVEEYASFPVAIQRDLCVVWIVHLRHSFAAVNRAKSLDSLVFVLVTATTHLMFPKAVSVSQMGH
jgi:hypothetical protein